MDKKKRFQELKKELEHHSKLYEEGHPQISDTEYDNLYFEFAELMEELGLNEDKNPVTTPTGVFSSELKKVKHKGFVGSLSKVKTNEGVTKWLDSVEKFAKDNGYPLPVEILCEYKFDGLTIVAEYEDGKLVSALTRGDGTYGESVLHTVANISNLPGYIPSKGYLRIRFEAEIDNETFEKINATSDYSNARNLVAGTIRQGDADLAKERNVKAFVFEVSEGMTRLKKESEMLVTLNSYGFSVPAPRIKSTANRNEILNWIAQVGGEERANLGFKIDGVVLKVNDVEMRQAMGTRHSNPRGAIAYKYPSQDATTTLREVTWDVGRTGKMAPVANFDPINIDGVVIAKATLHNINYIKARNLHIGDRILVARNNDVIPAVIANVKQTGTEKVTMPSVCPYCGTKLSRRENTYFCPSEKCSRRVYKNVVAWCSKGGANIMGLGPAGLAQLFDEGWITQVADIYHLYEHVPELIKMDGWGPDSTMDLIENIEDSRTITLAKFIKALGIDGVGDSASEVLAKKYKSMSALTAAPKADISRLPGFGKVLSENIVKFLQDNALMVSELEKELDIQFEEPIAVSGGSLAGKVFVITGTLTAVRDKVIERIEAAGGVVKGSVTKNTDYLVVGAAPGSTKVAAARKNGTTVINESELVDLLNNK